MSKFTISNKGKLEEHLLVFCGCVETEMFLPALRYILDQFDSEESVDYQRVAALLPPEAGAYAFLTLLDNRSILTHGGSIRNSFKGHPFELDDPDPVNHLKAVMLECMQGCDCSTAMQEVIEYKPEGPPQKRCRLCEKIVGDMS